MAETFHRRPVEVEAVQFIDGHPKAIRDFAGDAAQPVKDGNRVAWFYMEEGRDGLKLAPGEWLIRDHGGTYRVLSNETFTMLYDEGSLP